MPFVSYPINWSLAPLGFLVPLWYIEGMDKQTTPILAKSAPSGGNPAETYICPVCGKSQHVPNAVTIAALQEGQDIKNGKKKTKSYNSAEEFLADLKA